MFWLLKNFSVGALMIAGVFGTLDHFGYYELEFGHIILLCIIGGLIGIIMGLIDENY